MASATGTAKPERKRRSYRSRWLPGSRLGRLIIALNLLGLAILITGALVLNELRRGLVNARIDSLTTRRADGDRHRPGGHRRRADAGARPGLRQPPAAAAR